MFYSLTAVKACNQGQVISLASTPAGTRDCLIILI
jgi:hypothetical protein